MFAAFSAHSLDLAEIYGDEYFKGKVYQDYIQEEPVRAKLFREKLDTILKYLPGRGRILDVGCAAGFFLKIMEGEGYETQGVEISKYASSYARNVLKLNIVEGGLLSARFPDGFFDVITMWDVLEHLPNPLEALAECDRIMKKSGILIVETLNVDTLTVRILKQNWPLFKPPYHLFYFNRKTLKLMLSKSGFEIIRIIPIQTYVKTLKGFRAFRYFRYPLLRKSLGKIFDDVILAVAVKTEHSIDLTNV